MPGFVDIRGDRYGRLTVLSRAEDALMGSRCIVAWRCRCDCGEVVTVAAKSLRSGYTRSCGCLARELSASRARDRARHGEARVGAKTPEYRVWVAMWSRCTNPNTTNFKDYGGRGIKVCSAWSSFDSFLSDMGRKPTPQHSIDRIDNNGDYTPQNCRWATKSEQQKNKLRVVK